MGSWARSPRLPAQLEVGRQVTERTASERPFRLQQVSRCSKVVTYFLLPASQAVGHLSAAFLLMAREEDHFRMTESGKTPCKAQGSLQQCFPELGEGSPLGVCFNTEQAFMRSIKCDENFARITVSP